MPDVYSDADKLASDLFGLRYRWPALTIRALSPGSWSATCSTDRKLTELRAKSAGELEIKILWHYHLTYSHPLRHGNHYTSNLRCLPEEFRPGGGRGPCQLFGEGE